MFGFKNFLNDTKLETEKVQNFLSEKYKNKISELSLGDLKIAANLEIPTGTFLSWDELLEKIKEAKANLPRESVDLSLFNEQIQAAQKSVKTIDSAIDKIMEGKSFDDSEILALLKDFPKLGEYIDLVNEDFTGLQKGLEEVRKESLNDLVSQLEKAAETADEETAPALQTCIDLFKQMQNGTFNKNLTQKSFIDIKNIEDDVKLAEEKVRAAKENIVDENEKLNNWISEEGRRIGL